MIKIIRFVGYQLIEPGSALPERDEKGKRPSHLPNKQPLRSTKAFN